MSRSHTFTFQGKDFLLDGKPFRLRSGEIHYTRVPRPYWRHRLEALRAMGLNAVSIYCPWNVHEPHPGQWNFTDMADVAGFVRTAQELGLWVILRPGPYMCGEWDLGALPWWLLREPDIRLRCSDPRYLAAAKRYVHRLGQEVAPLCCTKGGPIILCQVENEYGAYGNDKVYLNALRDGLREAGFDVQLFTCDWAKPGALNAGSVDGLPAFANFGTKAREQIAAMRQLRPNQPMVCSEFWIGWFDEWGQPRKGTDDPAPASAELKWMLENDVSLNFYVFHGGTSWGPYAGANYGATPDTYEPHVSSYDYHAPLDEAGRVTPKYHAFREILAAHQPPGTTLPPIPPPPAPVIEIPRFELTESAALFDNLPANPAARALHPQPMEMVGQDFGSILYRTNIGGLGDGTLRVRDVHDYAKVFVDGKLVGTLDRRLGESKLPLKGIPTDAGSRCILDILVDTTGRVNFGHALVDRKGITERVEYDFLTLMNWEMFSFPTSHAFVSSLRFALADAAGPAYHRGTFHLDRVGDTFLDLRAWRRGLVWVNGRCLSRFWHVGPQQTAYLPGAWLRQGANEVIVFDLESTGRKPLAGLAEPILDDCTELVPLPKRPPPPV